MVFLVPSATTASTATAGPRSTATRRPGCAGASGLLEVLCPDLAAILHLRLAIEALRRSAVVLHRPQLIARRPLLPLITRGIPLVNVPGAIGENTSSPATRSAHPGSAADSSTRPAACNPRPSTRREIVVVPGDDPGPGRINIRMIAIDKGVPVPRKAATIKAGAAISVPRIIRTISARAPPAAAAPAAPATAPAKPDAEMEPAEAIAITERPSAIRIIAYTETP